MTAANHKRFDELEKKLDELTENYSAAQREALIHGYTTGVRAAWSFFRECGIEVSEPQITVDVEDGQLRANLRFNVLTIDARNAHAPDFAAALALFQGAQIAEGED